MRPLGLKANDWHLRQFEVCPATCELRYISNRKPGPDDDTEVCTWHRVHVHDTDYARAMLNAHTHTHTHIHTHTHTCVCLCVCVCVVLRKAQRTLG